ncbi:DUF2637 domain-containing protein [Rhodococcus koreensis]|uniref:DUF2637 domain-containing protein n=1 Tax=Rhodococcus koreensis TaxID=99653 RepID=UPI00366AA5CB
MRILSRLPDATPARGTAVGAVGVTALASWMSFTALSDLAAHNGIADHQSAALPLIVDGLTIVSTIAAAALSRGWPRAYAWILLVLGTAVSVAGNSAHAVTNGGGPIAVAISVIPPLVQLASIHLAITLANEEAPRIAMASATPEPVAEEIEEEELLAAA